MIPFEIVFWHWLALGVFLLIVELLAPGLFFLWMSQAAAITGVLLFVFPSMSWELQTAIFSVFSVIGIAWARRFFQRHPTPTDQPLLNRRTSYYVGRTFTLDQPIVNGQGKLRVDDSIWKINGPDCEAGSRVRIVAAENVVLIVEKIDH